MDILEGYALRTEGREAVLTVTLHNGSQGLSFFNHLELRCNGEYISPVFWSDNFVTLFPGETRVLEARFSREGLQGKIDVCID